MAGGLGREIGMETVQTIVPALSPDRFRRDCVTPSRPSVGITEKMEYFLLHGDYSDITSKHEKSIIRKSKKKFSIIGLDFSYSMLL